MGVNDGNRPSKIPNWQIAYMLILAFIQLIKFSFAALAAFQLFRYFQIQFMSAIVLLLAFLAGPVGCARYLLPAYPIMAVLTALGFICFIIKFPKIENIITKR